MRRRQMPPGPWQDSVARQYQKLKNSEGVARARLLVCSRHYLCGQELAEVLTWVRLANHCDRYGIDLQTHMADQERLAAAK